MRKLILAAAAVLLAACGGDLGERQCLDGKALRCPHVAWDRTTHECVCVGK